METTVKERLVQYLKFKKIGMNKFEGMAKLSSGYIANLKSNPGADILTKIFNTAPDLDRRWLLTGDGDMISSAVKDTQESIPLIPVNAIGGFLSGVSDPIMNYDCERYIVPLFKGADFLIRVDGDSMLPKYMPGDIVACRKIVDASWFQWGKTYVVDTKQGALIKRIEPSDKEGCIMLCSENEKYKPIAIDSNEINAVAIVKGVIRIE